ncbi:hypothetical protein GY45DRAFT_1439405 [Cubamyces sp. BRFM 1775]|nr:hypothetical protein GY45DRAFT_1439405 [Cubamyces sp. BRFM 1775]
MNGAVTNGRNCLSMFFSYIPGPKGVGGSYKLSLSISTASNPDMRAVITGITMDMIAGVATVAISLIASST